MCVLFEKKDAELIKKWLRRIFRVYLCRIMSRGIENVHRYLRNLGSARNYRIMVMFLYIDFFEYWNIFKWINRLVLDRIVLEMEMWFIGNFILYITLDKYYANVGVCKFVFKAHRFAKANLINWLIHWNCYEINSFSRESCVDILIKFLYKFFSNY